MKITRIQATNFLGARAVDISLAKPVCLIAGKNGAGKSSLREAIAMVLTADLGRVHLKKEAATLITDGAQAAIIEVDFNGQSAGVSITATGKISDTLAGVETPPALPYILDAQRFARLDEDARRAFVLGLMGMSMDRGTVKVRLAARGCAQDHIERIAPLLVSGCDAAAKEAAVKAREAKAAWKAITGGETWGKDKAPKWRPEALPEGAENAEARMANAMEQCKAAESALAQAIEKLGSAKAEAKARDAAIATRSAIAEKAERIDRIKNKLEIDRVQLDDWREKVAQAKRAASALKAGETACKCPECEAELVFSGGALYPHGDLRGDEGAAANLPEYERALALMETSVRTGERDFAIAEHAVAQLKELDALPEAPDLGPLLEAVANATTQRDDWRANADKYRALDARAKQQSKIIEQAAIHHRDVLEWTDIADALSPDGIPSELLGEALGPLNGRLAASADYAQWPAAVIDKDLRITAGGRAYGLLSESEKWRADAMIAEAVSHVSGARILVLDRADVLDIQGREDLLYWLDGIAANGDIDTAIVFATLKAAPTTSMENVQSIWIENGTTGTLREAA